MIDPFYRVGFLHWRNGEAVSFLMPICLFQDGSFDTLVQNKKLACIPQPIKEWLNHGYYHGWPWLTILPWLKFCWVILVVSRWVQQSLHKLQSISPTQKRANRLVLLGSHLCCCWKCCRASRERVVKLLKLMGSWIQMWFIHEHWREILSFLSAADH